MLHNAFFLDNILVKYPHKTVINRTSSVQKVSLNETLHLQTEIEFEHDEIIESELILVVYLVQCTLN